MNIIRRNLGSLEGFEFTAPSGVYRARPREVVGRGKDRWTLWCPGETRWPVAYFHTVAQAERFVRTYDKALTEGDQITPAWVREIVTEIKGD
jgi:hypothetical protein